MKKAYVISLVLCLVFLLSACTVNSNTNANKTETQSNTQPTEVVKDDGVSDINLSDNEILVDGKAISDTTSSAVYKANDIIYYEDGKDFTYGEGTKEEAHTKEEASAHTVVHITKAGTYKLSGKLTKGQIAVDLGENAEEDSKAVVTLILDNVYINCDIAPAVIFYNVYECGSDNTENATHEVDTQKSGANVIIADDSENKVNGSYVAKIYKPDSVVLNDDKTEVEDADKLHKYDAAFYSKMSMNINGGEKGNGILNINATNEGLDSELHLTINGGIININSGNDGINTNEDGVSVTTINSGELNITVTGETGEGDGIDSNGWLVINGGMVKAEACSASADAGIDSDMGIHINGGTVFATGSMLDRIEDGGQTYVTFNQRDKQSGEATLSIKNSAEDVLDEFSTKNDYSIILYSSDKLKDDTYYLYNGDTEISNSSESMTNGGMGRPQMPPDGTPPQGDMGDPNMEPPQKPDGMQPPADGMEPPQKPDGMEPPQKPDGTTPMMPQDSTTNNVTQI